MFNYLSPQGVIVYDTSEIKNVTEGEWKDVWGQDLDVSPETPQGMYIASDIMVRSEIAANNAAVANQINPNYSGGVWLDDIWALTGGTRRAASYTLVDGVSLAGTPGVVIPSGSRRATTSGDQFQLLSTVILDSSGQGTGIFQALEPGAVPCLVHTLTMPVPGYTSVGWETSSNPNAGITGINGQSDLSARQERRETLALQGTALAEAVYSRVRAVQGVKSISFRENFTSADKTIDGIFLVKNSIWACVDGGSDLDIANALYRSKSGGCNYNGSIDVDYREPLFGQLHVISFDRPTEVPVMCKVTYSIKGDISGDPEALIKQAVVDYAQGLLPNGETGFVQGCSVSPYEIGSAINLNVPSLFITKVEVAPQASTPTWSLATIAIGLNQKATINPDSILAVMV